jgi:hypothetical protein
MNNRSLCAYLFAVVLCLSIQSLLYAQPPPKTTLPKVLPNSPTRPPAVVEIEPVVLNAWVEDSQSPASAAPPLTLKWNREFKVFSTDQPPVDSDRGYFDIKIIRWRGCILYPDAPGPTCEEQQKTAFNDVSAENVILNLVEKNFQAEVRPRTFTFYFRNPKADPRLTAGKEYLFQIREKKSSQIVARSQIVAFKYSYP